MKHQQNKNRNRETQLTGNRSIRTNGDSSDSRTVVDVPDASRAELDAADFAPGRLTIYCSPDLTGGHRRQLRAMGHHLKPLVMVGHQGLHAGLASALAEALLRHELVKVRTLETCPHDTPTVALWCHRATEAAVAQILGRTILLYRRHPEKPVIRLR